MIAANALSPPVAEVRISDLLDRVAQVRPKHAARARAELNTSLAGLRSSATGELVWESSCLTPSRFPLEFAVTSASDELRTVVDVIAPEAGRGTALDEANHIAQGFGSPGLTPGMADLLREHQHRLPLRFGAWLGSRHTAAGTTHKIYVEVDRDPERAGNLMKAIAPEVWRTLGGAGPVRFVGLGLQEPRAVELYVRPAYTDGDLLRVLASRAGMPELGDPLALTIGPNGRGGGRNYGVSLASAHHRITAVAVFDFAHHRLGRDHRVRERVLAQAHAEGWPSEDLYAAATFPVAQAAPMKRPFHTALSEVAAVGVDKIVHHVGFAPPPAQPARSASLPTFNTLDRGEDR